ncbi:MAG: DJ-1/PfpI family protein, partial [Okeania sp. SIO2H7]|nr:DJ-1/PfpI family protein [Okeania sp. SIO2H7]
MIKSGDDGCLLVAGGRLDPNLTRLIEIAKSQEVPVCEVCHGQEDAMKTLDYLLAHDIPRKQ